MEQIFPCKGMKFRLVVFTILLISWFYDSGVVAQPCSPPGATIATPEILTCAKRKITLQGGPSVIGASYSWSSSNGFTSLLQNPEIAIPGTYYLTVTSPTGGCTSSTSVVVTQDTVQPEARAQVADIITCDHLSVIVQGISSTANAAFKWIGPGTFVQTTQNLSVTVDGGYTLMVTNPANGCVSTATANVVKNVELPTASAFVSGDLSCLVSTVQLTSSSGTPNVSFSWIGPGLGSSTSTQNATASAGGLYTVTTKNPVNGCISTASVNVIQDLSKPGAIIAASSSAITCAIINATLSGSSSVSNASYNWSGVGISLDAEEVIVTDPGTYVLTVIKPENGCISKDSVVITSNKVRPDITASVVGSITCTNPSAALNGSTTSTNVSYKWYGAFGTQYVQNTTTTLSGTYVFSVTRNDNGCISTKGVSVAKSVTPPASVNAYSSGTLTCSTTRISLTGSSSTSGVNYHWTGPDGTTYTGANPSVGVAGTYTLTVTNPANGCSAITTTTAAEDKTVPAAVKASNNGQLTCVISSVTLTGSSSTTGATFQWLNSSNAVLSNTNTASANSIGLYHVVVTHPSTGCTATAATNITLNTAKPGLIAAGNGGPLNCSLLSTDLNASSTTSTVTYNWTGPNGFSSASKNPTVSVVGTYKVKITNTLTGCADSTTTYLAKNDSIPGVTVAIGSAITCTNGSVTMSASSLTPGVDYHWSGPEYTSTEKEPVTNKVGHYIVVATNPRNYCTSKDSIDVVNDTIVPKGVRAAALDSITCKKATASLTAYSDDSNVSYAWTGPLGFTSVSKTPVATAKGDYIVTITKLVNGCKSVATAKVVKDSIPPVGVNAVPSGKINCRDKVVTINGSSNTSGVTYNWSGTGLPASTTTQSVTVDTKGTYFLTVTNPHNGCLVTTSAFVDEDFTAPADVTTSTPDTISCKKPNTTISATSATNGVVYNWAGPGGYVSNERVPSVHSFGDYTVTVTNPASNCFVVKTVTVVPDTITPAGVSASYQRTLTCNVLTSTLTGNSSTSGVTYAWTGPAGLTYSIPKPSVSKAGEFTLTVTNPTNGCQTIRSVIQPIDTIRPADVTASVSHVIDCNYQYVILTGKSSTSTATYSWNIDDFELINDSVYSDATEGVYKLIVTRPSNGCKVEKMVAVVSDYTQPVCNLDVAQTSTVLQQTTNTISSTYDPTYAYSWALNNWAAIGGNSTNTFTYKSGNTGTSSVITLNLMSNVNGCVNQCSATLTAVATKSAIAQEGLSSVQLVKDVTLTVYPTPAVGKVNVEFVSPEETDAAVTVYNTNGTAVANLFNNSAEAGHQYNLVFNETETLPAGVYICTLKTKTKTISTRIVIK